jgi:hypothetical protein
MFAVELARYGMYASFFVAAGCEMEALGAEAAGREQAQSQYLRSKLLH